MSDINLTVSDTTEPARSPHTLLLIENDPREADLVRFHLGNGSPELFTIVAVTSLAAAAQFLKEKPVDGVVVDLNLPDVRAIDVIHWARGVSNRAAVVLCSGTDDDQLQLLAYKEGIKEFVRKDRSQLPFLTHNILFAMERFRASRLREQLLKVVGQNPDAMVVTNTAGRVYFVNDAAVRLFQRSRKEMLESTIRFPIKEAELEEFEIVRKDGKRCAEIHLVSIEWDDRPALLATLRDVTDHRRISNRVREKQKLEAIGLLAGGIAHDFNNILTIILGNAQLAQVDVPKSHPIQALLRENVDAATRGASLVRQILAFSRPEDTVLTNCSLENIIHDSIRLLSSTLAGNINVVLHIEPNLPPTRANIAQMQQVIVNLCTNAAYAMREKGGTLELNLTIAPVEELMTFAATELVAARYARIDVKDTGIGMDRNTLERIFEPFFTTKPQGEGSGLGLAVVHGIVRSHGGMIAAFSEPGAGSVFRVYLPCVHGDAKSSMEMHVTHRGNGQHILCVDDEAAIATLLSRLLERLGYRVTTFTNPRAALEAYQEDPRAFDAVVTDLSMPGIDGPALVRELRALTSDLPIVMMTGFLQPEELGRARDLGVGALLLKPDSLQELGEVLHKLLR